MLYAGLQTSVYFDRYIVTVLDVARDYSLPRRDRTTGRRAFMRNYWNGMTFDERMAIRTYSMFDVQDGTQIHSWSTMHPTRSMTKQQILDFARTLTIVLPWIMCRMYDRRPVMDGVE